MEFPSGSRKMWTFPEIDRVELLPIDQAKEKLRPQQAALLDRLSQAILWSQSARAR